MKIERRRSLQDDDLLERLADGELFELANDAKCENDVFIVLPRLSKYFCSGPTVHHVHVLNLSKNTVHSRAPDTRVIRRPNCKLVVAIE